MESKNYLHEQETYKLIGLAMEVHRHLGKGFSEVVYKDAIEYELKNNNIIYQREKEYAVNYKGTILKHKFYADFVVYDKIILELKSKKGIIEDHYAQVINHLTISKHELGLLINFHEKSLEFKRIISTS